jgi:hypothetical protein
MQNYELQRLEMINELAIIKFGQKKLDKYFDLQ